MSLRTGLFGEIERDVEQITAEAEMKRDEYKRLLDKIHTLVIGETDKTAAYVELPAAIQSLIDEKHFQWKRAITAEEKMSKALQCLDNASFDAGAMAARKILRGGK